MAAASTVADDVSQLGKAHGTSQEKKGTTMSPDATRNITLELKWVAALGALAVIAVALVPAPAAAQQTSTATYTPAEQPKGKAFPKPEAAAAALYAATKRNDEAELLVILGPDGKEVVQWTDDPAERQDPRAEFAQKYEQMHRLIKEPDNTVALYVGAENWPLPIPLVEYHGAWYFDADLGQQEIRYRRIGHNEMEALEVCHTLVDAEKEYRSIAHQYTANFTSSDDSHDGLYWKSAGNAAKSPIGPYLAHAGISGPDKTYSQPFHGYYYRILLQGSDTFAIIAFPADYRSSGVMTFLINQDGPAYEKDFGEQTASLARQVSSSHIDNSWKQVE